jgi:hypothetical protein
MIEPWQIWEVKMAIVGNGDIASVLGPFDREGWLFFASGVSNSGETRESEYEREIELMRSFAQKGYHFVYFSSLGVMWDDSRYLRHKRQMEVMVKALFLSYTIVRLGNITWGTNPHTLLNFLRGALERGEKPVIQNVDRFIVDEDEFLCWITLLPDFNCEVNVPGKRMKVPEIWKNLQKEALCRT